MALGAAMTSLHEVSGILSDSLAPVDVGGYASRRTGVAVAGTDSRDGAAR
jgi:hypothetical protein